MLANFTMSNHKQMMSVYLSQTRSWIFLLLLNLAVMRPVCAQTDCKKLLHDVFAQAQAEQKNLKRIYHTTCTQTSHFRMQPGGALQHSTVKLEVYIGPSLVYYTGDGVVCMQDKVYLVSILTREKKIMVKPSADSLRQQAQVGNWSGIMQDTLLQNIAIESCQTVTEKTGILQKIVADVLPAYQPRWQAKQYTFWVNEKDKRMVRIEMVHLPPQIVERSEVTFSRPEWMDAIPGVPASAKGLVWDGKGKLLPAYQGYEVLRVK